MQNPLTKTNKDLEIISTRICNINNNANTIKKQIDKDLKNLKNKNNKDYILKNPQTIGVELVEYVTKGDNILKELSSELEKFNEITSKVPIIIKQSNINLSDLTTDYEKYSNIVKKTNNCYTNGVNILSNVANKSDKGVTYLETLFKNKPAFVIPSILLFSSGSIFIIIIIISFLISLYFIYQKYYKEENKKL